MRTYSKAIFILLLFVVLLSPVKVEATDAPEVYPIGIVIDIHPCDASNVSDDYYYVDIVAPREDVESFIKTPTATYRFPDDLLNSVYSSSENEWVSVILFMEYNEWVNQECRTIFYSDAFDSEQIPFDQYKVVIYEDGQEPVESSIYDSSESATYDHPFGYKTFYNPESKAFSRAYYEAETFYGGGVNFDGLLYFLIGVFAVLISVFVLMESFIYLVARQGWKSVLITLGFNALVFLIAYLQVIEIYGKLTNVALILGIILIPGIYTIKVLLVKRYTIGAHQISILISVIYYGLYFFFTAFQLT